MQTTRGEPSHGKHFQHQHSEVADRLELFSAAPPDLMALAQRDRGTVSMTGRNPTPEYIEKIYALELADEVALPCLVSETNKPAFNREADYIKEHHNHNQENPRNATYKDMRDIALALHRANNLPDYRLSEAEKVAIYEYTTDNDFIANFNALQRSDPKQALDEYGGFIATLSSALNKLPAYKGQVWRGSKPLPEKAMTEFKEGSLITPSYFWSSSRNQKVATNDYRARVLFDIMSRNGKDIQQMSAKPHEEEVLFAADTVFRVERNRWNSELGRQEIKLTEL